MKYFSSQCLLRLFDLGAIKLFDDTGRHTRHHRIRRHIPVDNRSCGDHAAPPHARVIEDDRARADIRACFDGNASDFRRKRCAASGEYPAS